MINIKELEKVFNGRIDTFEKVNVGYSREVYKINNEFILKIVKNLKCENDSKKEVDFCSQHHFSFTPRIISSDFSKTIIPYSYFVEENIPGVSLMGKWKELKEDEKERIIEQLLNKLDILHKTEYDCQEDNLSEEFDGYLKAIIESKILTEDQIKYLRDLKEVIPYLIKGRQRCLIHGDFHFDNVLIDNNLDCKIIDFERVKKSYLEREYDPLNRMARNPNALINNSMSIVEDKKDFATIMKYVFAHYPEIDSEEFSNLLLLFDCLNSMMWLPKFPDFELYNEILFNKSKKLTRI